MEKKIIKKRDEILVLTRKMRNWSPFAFSSTVGIENDLIIVKNILKSLQYITEEL